ncbi:MAG TPA: hypothetical protein VGG05_14045 [Pseudonocardiaceae bacterium]|jgi:hypothetical protein
MAVDQAPDRALDPTGALDEAYERLHTTGPEFAGWLSNHGPMAVEAMVRGDHADTVHRWVDRYSTRLDDLPAATGTIGDDWQVALGDERRIGDWIEHFTRTLDEQPWQDVLAVWWPRLLPGIVAGATHGVIRVGHAVRVLLAEQPTEPRIAELGHGLGYWAARWQLVPGVVAPAGAREAAAALRGVARLPEQTGDIRERVARLADLHGWSDSMAALRAPGGPDDVPGLLADVVDSAVLRYRTHGHGSGVMMVHSATAPNAVLRVLPALPKGTWADSLAAAWAATATVTSVYAPAEPAAEADLPAPTDTAADALALALRNGNEHAIKFADTATDTYARTGDPAALSGAVRATTLIDD